MLLQPFTRTLLCLGLVGLLPACNPVKQLEDDCSAGDASACDILATIALAVDELEDAVPSDLVLASAFEEATDTNLSAKQARIEAALDPAIIGRDGLAACLRALPPPPQNSSPVCYGPEMDYSNHPDFSTGTPAADGRLPSGDLGIWLDTEPTASAAGDAPCAAVKMNELIAKAIHNVDMATGSVAMMMCAAAHERISAPNNAGDVLDFSTVLNSVPNSPLTISTATLERVDANTLKTVLVASHDGGSNNRFGQFSISTTHNSTSRSGLVQIERGQTGQAERTRVTSARYRPNPQDPLMLELRVQQANFLNSANTPYFDAEGDVKLGPVTGNPNRNIEDSHLLLAQFTPSTGAQTVAYGWNAGGNDSHSRVFNAQADSTTASAWYGFVANPYAQDGSAAVGEQPNLDLSASSAGMICNWAGPGNNHSPVAFLQHQSMTKDSQDHWILAGSGSLIRYVPTVACELPTNSSAITFSARVPNGASVQAGAMAAHNISAGQTFVQSTSNTVGLDPRSNHNISLPDASW